MVEPAGVASLLAFLAAAGADKVVHTSRPYAAHLTAVHDELAAWGRPADVCSAGFLHSIYGTERFGDYALPLARRPDVRALAGERAELLAYANCAMVRADFDRAAEGRAPYRFADRLGGGTLALGEADFQDLSAVHLCDWLEQVPRVGQWSYRRAAYRWLAVRLGGTAAAAFERVYAGR